MIKGKEHTISYLENETYQTHWLKCCAIALKLFQGCSFMMITLLGCILADKIDSQMSTGPQYLRKILRLTSSQALTFLPELVCKNFLHVQQSDEEWFCGFMT
jgi:hypothetical protein